MGLREVRIEKGLTQEELAERSGVHRDTIQKLETGQREARPATVKKLADALGVEEKKLTTEGKEKDVEQTRRAQKIEVEVRWETDHGFRGEKLRFRGEEIDSLESSDSYFTLYECPGGYRVHVENGGDGTAYLNPSYPERVTGELEYPTYSVEELVREFPEFGEAVGVYRVRDID